MLSPMQKAQIRLFLGYPDHFRYKSTRLEGVLDNLSPEAETQVAELIGQIKDIETQALSAGTVNAGLKRVDEIWFETGTTRVTTVRKTGRHYVSRLSILLGVPIYSDYFGGGGYEGDSFTQGGARRGGFYGLG